jgi:hypothetical protein
MRPSKRQKPSSRSERGTVRVHAYDTASNLDPRALNSQPETPCPGPCPQKQAATESNRVQILSLLQSLSLSLSLSLIFYVLRFARATLSAAWLLTMRSLFFALLQLRVCGKMQTTPRMLKPQSPARGSRRGVRRSEREAGGDEGSPRAQKL